MDLIHLGGYMKLQNNVYQDIRIIEYKLSKTKNKNEIVNLFADYEQLIEILKFIDTNEKVTEMDNRLEFLISRYIKFEDYDNIAVKNYISLVKKNKYNNKLNLDESVNDYFRIYCLFAEENKELDLPRYSYKELLEIVDNFCREETRLKPFFDKLVKTGRISILEENINIKNCNGFFVKPHSESFEPYIITTKDNTIASSKIIAHELGHYLDYSHKKDRYDGALANEILPIIYSKKFLDYVKDNFSEDEYLAVALEYDKLTLALHETYKNKDKLKLGYFKIPDADTYIRHSKYYKYALGYLVTLNKDYINDDEIERFLKLRKNNVKNSLASFNLIEETLYDEKVLAKRFTNRVK